MRMTFNDFQVELNKRVDDPRLAYMFSFLYESMTDALKQVDEMASMLTVMAENLRGMLSLDDVLNERIRRLENRDAIVDSVRMDEPHG